MDVLLALIFLSGSVYCLNGNDISVVKNETRPLDPKTFRGTFIHNDTLPVEMLNGDTEATAGHVQDAILNEGTIVVNNDAILNEETIVVNNDAILNEGTIVVHNSTLVYLRSSTSRQLIPAIYIIVILIGIPSNILILRMLFARVRSVCTAIFYTNLAISDFLFCLMLPFKAAYHLDGNNWIFGETMCQAMTICFYGNMYCSILLIMCISISRYIAIVHPFIYRSLPKRTCAILLCVLVWIIVLVFMIPFFTLKQTYKLKDLHSVSCSDVYESSADSFQFYYFISLVVFGYLVPLSVVAFCHFSIIRTLGTHDPKRFLYLKITILLLVIFTLCFTPSNLILLIHQLKYHYSKVDTMYAYYQVALSFSSLNSCLDPFLYFLMSEITKPSKIYAKINKLPNETHKTLLIS
ncbi:proteinase-activated receptor 3 [Mixophyes fleayi]|uniref:proteinase-activated receptor 3 n=1 Tax=Mixophyes fleayi TaxID=3061075 RepID=UPI003F4DC0A4